MLISIFTPTFNRLETLKRLYHTLLIQKEYDFEWIIIDDGSSDGTKEYIENIKTDAPFEIIYKYQENKGKYISTNRALDYAKGELFFNVDSDDFLIDDAITIIKNNFKKYNQSMVLLDKDHNDEIIGVQLPEGNFNWIELRYKEKCYGDKSYIFKTKILREIYFPESNEKHMPPTYQYIIYGDIEKFRCINIPIKVVEYLDDGITFNIRNKLIESPKNYLIYRELLHKYLPSYKEKSKNIILYNISYLARKKLVKPISKNLIDVALSYILLPISYIYYIYIKK